MKKGITIKDIAKKLNMSVSTVSKALNNDVTISALTKERVQDLAKKLNYVPNEAARNFKLSKTYTIGLIIPDLLDQFFVLAVNGVEEVAEREKYNVILAQSHEEVSTEEKIIKVMIRNRVDGVIVAMTKHTTDMQLFNNLLAMGIPVVFIAREPPDNTFNFVITKNEEGAFAATRFLIEKGHTRIAHLMGPTSMQTSNARLRGYKNALHKNDLPLDEALIRSVDFSSQSVARAIDELLSLPDPPTAAFVYKTYITLDAIKYLAEKSSGQLNTIDFVGFGNLPLLQYLIHKPAASIEENSFKMGGEAAKLLFRMIEVDELADLEPEHIQIDCNLVIH